MAIQQKHSTATSEGERLASVRVECYAGYRGEQTPQRFYLGNNAMEIVEVTDQWLAPDHRYFKCVCADDDTYILRHDVRRDRWELTLYKRRGGGAGDEIPNDRR